MKQTVVGVFDRYEEARRAATMLESNGFPSDCVHVTASGESTTTTGTTATTVRTDRDEDTGVMASIRSFFAEIFGSGEHDDVNEYAEHVKRGGAVVKVDVEDDSRVDAAREALQSAGAVNIDERVAQWRESGWTGGIATAGAADTGLRGSAAADVPGSRGTARSAGEEVIPVMREEIQVGKRAVSTGGVRVYSHTLEKPVQEQLELREEHARVERRPADRPVGEAEARAFQDRTIEVRETAEQPVVQKTARVVEEVVVGKETNRRTETVRDTVRETEVDVRPLAGSEAGTTTGSATMRPFSAYDQDFRSDFQTRYGSTGGRYEDYSPAYEYGYGLAGDSRYAGRDWDQFETEARSDWERRNPNSPWERVKAAVRHGWERVKS